MFINYSNPLNFQVKCDEHFPSLTMKTLFDGKRNLFFGILFRQIELFASINYLHLYDVNCFKHATHIVK